MGILSVLIIIVCILLILVVLVQNSKGGGLSSGFSSGNQMMGVRKTTDFLEKATWGLAGVLLVLSLMAAPKAAIVDEDGQTTQTEGSVTKGKANTTSAPGTTAPTTTTEATPDAGAGN